jgi:hypothetical protein
MRKYRVILRFAVLWSVRILYTWFLRPWRGAAQQIDSSAKNPVARILLGAIRKQEKDSVNACTLARGRSHD